MNQYHESNNIQVIIRFTLKYPKIKTSIIIAQDTV
jgi:hypothetical protein